MQAVDDATEDIAFAVHALRDETAPMPADLSEVFGALGQHLNRLDHLAATLGATYDRLPDGLRCDNGADPFTTVREVLLGIDDIRMHIDRAGQALLGVHNHAARIATT